MIRWTAILIVCWSTIGIISGRGSHAGEPSLHERIDQLIAAAADGPLAKQADDAEFPRRVSLDLAGRIPSVEETRPFLEAAAADKRTALIDQLLGGSEFPQRMSSLMHVILMERLGDDAGWTK